MHMLNLVKQNLAWYLINGCVSEQAALKIDEEFDAAVKAYVPYTNTAIGGLGLPELAKRSGTIARDYVAYNSQPDPENLDAAGDLFDFRQTGVPRPRL